MLYAINTICLVSFAIFGAAINGLGVVASAVETPPAGLTSNQLTGHVWRNAGAGDLPLAGAVVHIYSVSDFPVEEDGSYAVSLEAGSYWVRASAPGYEDLSWEYVDLSQSRGLDFTFVVSPLSVTPAIPRIEVGADGFGTSTMTLTNNQNQAVIVEVQTDYAWVHTSGLCGRSSSRPYEGAYSWYFGSEVTGNYDTGEQVGGVLMFLGVKVPAEGASLNWMSLGFCDDRPGRDLRTVDVSNDDGRTWTNLANIQGGYGLWTEGNAWIGGELAGATVRIRFRFDSVDGIANDFEGWYVDRVSLGGEVLGAHVECDPLEVTLAPGASTDVVLTTSNEWSDSVAFRSSILVRAEEAPPITVPVDVVFSPVVVLDVSVSMFHDPQDGGDWDARIEPGESAFPTLRIVNNSELPVYGATIRIEIDDPFVTVIQPESEVGYLGPWTVNMDSGTQISVASDCPARHSVYMHCIVSDEAGGSWSHNAWFTVLPVWAVSGVATLADGSPLAGVAISDGRNSMLSGADGTYRLEGLHPGQQVIEATMPGYGPVRRIFAGDGDVVWNVILGQPALTAQVRAGGVTMLMGTVGEAVLDIGNEGDVDLEWHLVPQVDGYSARRSDEPEGPDPAWEELPVDARDHRELRSGVQKSLLPFCFPLYGEANDRLSLSPCGYATLESVPELSYALPLPSLDAPRNLIAHLWGSSQPDDARIRSGRMDADGWVFEVMNAAANYSRVSCQVRYGWDGTVTLRYPRSSDWATVAGLQDAAGIRGVQLDATGLPEGPFACEFRPSRHWAHPIDHHGHVAPGGLAGARLSIDARSLPPGRYQTTVRVRSNDPARLDLRVPLELDVLAAPPPVVTLSGPATVPEGLAGMLRVELSEAYPVDLTVGLAETSGDAEADDHLLETEILIPAGSTSGIAFIGAFEDADADDEVIGVSLVEDYRYALGDPSGIAIRLREPTITEPPAGSARRIGFVLRLDGGAGLGSVQVRRSEVAGIADGQMLVTRPDGSTDDDGIDAPEDISDDPRLFGEAPAASVQAFDFTTIVGGDG